MLKELRKRYPGINFFTSRERDIFCGRADDAKKLFNRLMLNNTLVLHGESGMGKSSLVQAGLIPLLEAHNVYLKDQGKPQYLPVTVRFDAIQKMTGAEQNKINEQANASPSGGKDILLKQSLKGINDHNKYRMDELPFISYREDSFWYTAKQFEKNNFTLLLIFDQFEELQGYSHAAAEYFTQKLSELFVSTMPESIYKEYTQNTESFDTNLDMTEEANEAYNRKIRLLEQPLSVKILFVLREDKLGTMSMLSDYFPDILKNDFFLSPLDKTGATKAIVEPAQKTGDFKTQPFAFEENAVNSLLQNLVDTNTGLYDPIQLQIVCSSIEKKLPADKTLIMAGDIPPLKDIIRDFYQEIWSGIKTKFKMSSEAFEKKRKDIIEYLEVNGRRNLVLENLLIIDGNKQDEDIINALVREGLLRKIPSGSDTYYQLCHDRLMIPLTEDWHELKLKENMAEEQEAQKAIDRKRKNILWRIAFFVVLLISSAAIYFYFQAKKAERIAAEQRYLLISNSIKRDDNPTLAYIIAKDWFEKNKNSDAMKNYLASFDTTGYFYLTGIYPALAGVTTATIPDNNNLLIKGDNGMIEWDTRNYLVKRTLPAVEADGIATRQIHTPGGKLNFYFAHNYFYITRESGDTLTRLMNSGSYDAEYGYDDEKITLSPNEHYLVIGNTIYNTRLKKKIAVLKEYTTKTENGTPLSFAINNIAFIDTARFAALYENGIIFIYRIKASGKEAVIVVDSLRSAGSATTAGAYNNSTIIFNSKYKYLFATDEQNGIDVYDINKFDSAKGNYNLDSIDLKIANLSGALKNNDPFLIKKLKGHTGQVNHLCVSAKGEMLISAGNDNTSVLWKIASLQKIQTLKIKTNESVDFATFTNNDSNIICITNEYKIYVWKNSSPVALYQQSYLYQFGHFNYLTWGLTEYQYNKKTDTASTLTLYKCLLNSLVNMPISNDYPNDENYNNNLRTAATGIKDMYNRFQYLIKDKYRKSLIPEYNLKLLDENYYEFLLREESFFPQKKDQTEYEVYITKARRNLIQWKEFFLDTSANRYKAFGLTGNLHNYTVLLLDKNDLTDAARFIKFYTDSVLQPLKTQYGQSSFTNSIELIINQQWMKYYLYLNKPEKAVSIYELQVKKTPRAYQLKNHLVVTYLVAGKYAEACNLYDSVTKNANLLQLTEKTLMKIFTVLKKRKIAEENIRNFEIKYELLPPKELAEAIKNRSLKRTAP